MSWWPSQTSMGGDGGGGEGAVSTAWPALMERTVQVSKGWLFALVMRAVERAMASSGEVSARKACSLVVATTAVTT